MLQPNVSQVCNCFPCYVIDYKKTQNQKIASCQETAVCSLSLYCFITLHLIRTVYLVWFMLGFSSEIGHHSSVSVPLQASLGCPLSVASWPWWRHCSCLVMSDSATSAFWRRFTSSTMTSMLFVRLSSWQSSASRLKQWKLPNREWKKGRAFMGIMFTLTIMGLYFSGFWCWC